MIAHGYDMDAHISNQQFQQMLVEPQVVKIVNDVGVDSLMVLDMSQTIFDDLAKSGAHGLTFAAFVGLVLDMRGTNPAKVKDVREQLRFVKLAIIEAMAKLNIDVLNLHQDVRAMRADMEPDHDDEDSHAEVTFISKANGEVTPPDLIDTEAADGDEDVEAEI